MNGGGHGAQRDSATPARNPGGSDGHETAAAYPDELFSVLPIESLMTIRGTAQDLLKRADAELDRRIRESSRPKGEPILSSECVCGHSAYTHGASGCFGFRDREAARVFGEACSCSKFEASKPMGHLQP